MNKISISENQKHIMLCKIQFLEKQLEQGAKREKTLQQINQQLRNTIPQLINDRAKIVSIQRGQNFSSNLLNHESNCNRDIEIQSLKSKLKSLTESNFEYQKELRRMQSNMKQHIQSVERAHQRDINHYEKKIQCLEMRLSKYHDYQKLQEELEQLRLQNKELKRNKRDLTTSQLHTSNINTSQIELESMIKTLNQRDSTFTLEDIENVSFNRIPTQSDCSSSKQKTTMVRSSSALSEIKRNVISSLYCQQCNKNYAPNEYYKHLEIHEEKARLMQEKADIQKKIREKGTKIRLQQQLTRVSGAIKNHPAGRNCASARNLIR